MGDKESKAGSPKKRETEAKEDSPKKEVKEIEALKSDLKEAHFNSSMEPKLNLSNNYMENSTVSVSLASQISKKAPKTKKMRSSRNPAFRGPTETRTLTLVSSKKDKSVGSRREKSLSSNGNNKTNSSKREKTLS